jgi:uncharacterized protein
MSSIPLASAAIRGRYVYDYVGLLNDSEKGAIESLCLDVDANTTAEIVIVIIADLSEYNGDVNSAKVKIFNQISLDGITGIGKKEKNNGVLILVSELDREWGIEVGYGLEGEINDAKAGRIGRDILTPYLKDGDYYSGLWNSAATIAEQIGFDVEGYTPSPLQDPSQSFIDVLLSGDWLYVTWWLLGSGSPIWLVLVVVIIFALIFSKSRGGGGGGRSGGGGASGRW